MAEAYVFNVTFPDSSRRGIAVTEIKNSGVITGLRYFDKLTDDVVKYLKELNDGGSRIFGVRPGWISETCGMPPESEIREDLGENSLEARTLKDGGIDLSFELEED